MRLIPTEARPSPVHGIGMFTKVPVAAGEELTIDYGTIDGGDRDKLAQGLPLFGARSSTLPD